MHQSGRVRAKKYCSVPCCQNNSERNINKLFLRIPSPKSKREKWYKAINQPKILKTTNAYVCEDHFNVSTYQMSNQSYAST